MEAAGTSEMLVPVSNTSHGGTSQIMMIMIIIVIIIIIISISFVQGIRTYIPQTNHVSRVHSVAAILVHITLSSILTL
jgi:uncharacterized membrane protein